MGPMAPAGYGDRVEGLHAVRAAAAAGRVERLYVERGRRDRPDIREIIALVGESSVSLVDDARSHATSEAPQGLVAECRRISSVPIDQLAGRTDALLLLDHLEDPHNLGATARSALAAGIGGLVIPSRRSAPLSATAFKAAAGALESLPVAIVNSIPDALVRLKTAGFWIVGLEAGADRSLFGLDLLTEPVAMVVGAEGEGLGRLVSERCDLLVSIPMASDSESLNASVSAALASFEIMRVRSRGPDSLPG